MILELDQLNFFGFKLEAAVYVSYVVHGNINSILTLRFSLQNHTVLSISVAKVYKWVGLSLEYEFVTYIVGNYAV
jgi:hypothetical protein